LPALWLRRVRDLADLFQELIRGCLDVAWKEQDFSLVDHTGFVVMRRLGIYRVASLDEHFGLGPFGSKRREAFTVRR
jgi:predicted nucleic acid-binding protein